MTFLGEARRRLVRGQENDCVHFEKRMTHEELHNLRGHGLEGGMGSSWVESEQAFHVCVGASLGESEHEFVMV